MSQRNRALCAKAPPKSLFQLEREREEKQIARAKKTTHPNERRTSSSAREKKTNTRTSTFALARVGSKSIIEVVVVSANNNAERRPWMEYNKVAFFFRRYLF
jgi:epoxyqueuosine reductase QueG